MTRLYPRLLALLAAFAVPYLIFSVVIGLNQSDLDRDFLQKQVSNFDVEKKKEIQKREPEPEPERQRRRATESLPSMEPVDLGGPLDGSGLSFGVPQFNETEFAEFEDNDLLNAKNSGPMDQSSVDTPPRVVKRSPIVYPELARKQGVSGFVRMNVLINESGRVEDVKIVESEPEEIFDLKADSTVRQWQFEPATYNGKKVAVWATQKIVFKLN
jgi:periplasmic protein TonB